MKFYVAGKFSDYSFVRSIVDMLAEHGHTVTYDWTRTSEFGPDGHPVSNDPHDLSKEQLGEYAQKDVQGVQDADFLVVCADQDLCGAWIEMGVALATKTVQKIFVIASERWTIFLELPFVEQVCCYDEFQDLVSSGQLGLVE